MCWQCPNKQGDHWRKLATETRQVYKGLLTVAIIDGHEHEVKWLDAVDVIGIDAYYNVDGANVGAMVQAWTKYIALAKGLHEQHGKPVAFTEVGYCSGHCKRDHAPVYVEDICIHSGA